METPLVLFLSARLFLWFGYVIRKNNIYVWSAVRNVSVANRGGFDDVLRFGLWNSVAMSASTDESNREYVYT